MSLPMTLAKAFAPLAGAALAPDAFLTAAGVSCVMSATLLWMGESPARWPTTATG